MANNYSSKFFGGATNGVIVTVSAAVFSRVVAVHAAAVTATGTFTLSEGGVDKLKFQVPASGTADVYLGEAGIKCNGQVSIATPNAGSVTLILG